jgi:hypothetical protein
MTYIMEFEFRLLCIDNQLTVLCATRREQDAKDEAVLVLGVQSLVVITTASVMVLYLSLALIGRAAA